MLTNIEMARISTLHPALRVLVEQAATELPGDFLVFETLRAVETQRRYVQRGMSRTMNSKHLKQPDGFAHAVDLVPLMDGQPRWEWSLIWPIADVMRQLAIAAKVPVTWGGIWDRRLDQLAGGLRAEVDGYCLRHPGPDFLDGPHYELATNGPW